MSDMAKAYTLAAHAVRQRLEEQHPERLEVLNGLTGRDVAVFTGQYDSVQEVLRRLKVPFVTDPWARNLRNSKIAFANCTGTTPRVLSTRAEPFVRDGGWLVSTDWSLESVVQRHFPGTVRRKASGITPDQVVAVEADNGSLWSEVVVLGTDPQWWLETSSYPIEILDEDKVHVEAASHELYVQHQAPAVAVRFDWHAGHVYHVISHLWLKRTRVPRQGRYGGSCLDFLREGMRLSETGIEQACKRSRIKVESLNFATMQSAATSTELVAQLCIESVLAGELATA